MDVGNDNEPANQPYKGELLELSSSEDNYEKKSKKSELKLTEGELLARRK